MKMNVHSINGNTTPSEWMRSTCSWNDIGPLMIEALVSRCTTM